MGDSQAIIFLLEKIDRQQQEQGTDIKEMRTSLSDGRVLFENHERRISSLETGCARTCHRPAAPSTDRTERKHGAASNPLAERLSVGAIVKIIGAVAVLVGAFFAGGKALS